MLFNPIDKIIIVCFFYTANTNHAYGVEQGFDESFLAILGSVCFISGMLRFLCSLLMDIAGYKVAYGTMLILQMILCLTFNFIKNYKPAFFIYICMMIFLGEGHFVIIPTIISLIFAEQAPVVYGVSFSLNAVSSLTCSAILYFGLNWIKELGGYGFMYYIIGGMNFVAFILLIFVFKYKKVLED